jgi:hypothetical protein
VNWLTSSSRLFGYIRTRKPDPSADAARQAIGGIRMPINMQGAWTVSVSFKEPGSSPSRFIISGAATGNGTYNGATATPAVNVTGDAWSITVENNSGSGWVTAFDQITFPTRSGGNYHFNIQTNDDDSDPIFDDLILACSTPVTVTDFLIYGNVSHYNDFCIFNPCSPIYLVIETQAALARALQNPTLRAAIQTIYPQRVGPLPPGPIPDPPPFRKLVIPLRNESAIPTQIAQVFSSTGKNDVAAAAGAAPTPQLLATRALNRPAATAASFDKVAVSGIVDHLFGICHTGPLAGRVLRFLQYDRTAAELAGGPYTGTGPRETLGVCTTDRHGNYVFRFQRSFAQDIHEALVDVAPGEDVFTAVLPDVIVQLLDPMQPGGFCYESTPFWNIPFFRQVNICVPDECIGRLPTACQGHYAIQSIGNIFIGEPTLPQPQPGQPNGYGPRVGFSNSLGSEGLITARSAVPGTPQARCAGWFSQLDFFACFLDHPEVAYYTIRWRPHGTTDWNFFTETYIHPQIAKIGIPGYSGDLVGPQLGVSLQVDGSPAQLAPAYLNIENDPAWVFTHRDRKAVITSSIYAPTPGSVDFRINGYTSGGANVAAVEDCITLFIDNPNGGNPDFDIDSVSMAAQSGGDCALFNLGGQANVPLTVTFHANQTERLMQDYGISVRKGNIGGFAITGGGPGQLSGSYVHGDDLVCSSFEGTFDDPTHDGSGAVTADITATSGHWLDPGQPFCTFSVNLSCSVRITNGYNSAVYSFGPKSYLLGIQAT